MLIKNTYSQEHIRIRKYFKNSSHNYEIYCCFSCVTQKKLDFTAKCCKIILSRRDVKGYIVDHSLFFQPVIWFKEI